MANEHTAPVSRRAEALAQRWRYVERAVFALAFCYTGYSLVAGLVQYLSATGQGRGFMSDFLEPFHSREYYKSALAIIGLLISAFTVWEIARLLVRELRDDRARTWGLEKVRRFASALIADYQATFLVALVLEFLPRLIVIDMFWKWQPTFQKLSLFSVGHNWYGWIYALLVWELSTWVWHFGAHRIRVFWCLHSPHHAPANFNMTVAWVHFFAEGYVTAVIQLVILMVLGVAPATLVVIMTLEALWGTLIHAGERTLKTGRLGWARFFIITPSHHRVHHARNPLYMDTNFCTMLPVWDWMFGTLQPLRDEVRIEYGITRKTETGSFIDLYFGECVALFRDLRQARGWRLRLQYAFKPPGWRPNDTQHTAAVVRGEFLRTRPELGIASKRQWLQRLRGPSATGGYHTRSSGTAKSR